MFSHAGGRTKVAFTRLTFDVDGERQVSRAFMGMERDLADLSEPLEEIAGLIRQAIGEEFGTEGARGGDAWAPLSPAYEKWKEQHFPGRPLLVQHGDMRRALLDRTAFRVTNERLVYYPDTSSANHPEIAGFHQRGSGDLPRRKMVDVTAEDRRAFEREIHDWLIARRNRNFAA